MGTPVGRRNRRVSPALWLQLSAVLCFGGSPFSVNKIILAEISYFVKRLTDVFFY